MPQYVKLTRRILILGLAVMVVAPGSAKADTSLHKADFYVSTKGSDEWSGTLPQPNAREPMVPSRRWSVLAMRFGI